MTPTRDGAWNLLCEYTQSESLRKHALAVEACVRAYARRFAAGTAVGVGAGLKPAPTTEAVTVDEALWGLTALLHDFDYERWPNAEHSPTQGHPFEGSKILRQHGYPEEMVRAILSHADYSGVPRQSLLEHTLYACDELAGFLTACALVQPTKSIHEVKVPSVLKKLKDKAFAKGVNRDDVRRGAEELGLPLEEHVAFCLAALQASAADLGLAGAASAVAPSSPPSGD
jgi:predicted hydrolase (HD superfamily)